MSRSRRNFSAEFKTNLVLQLLKGEKELNVFAVENDIQPNLLRNWKKEFLTTADPLPKNARKKLNTPKRSVNLLCRLTGSKKKSEEVIGPDYESKFSPKPFDD